MDSVRRLAAVFLLAVLCACTTANQAASISIDGILALSDQLDQYERLDMISSDTEIELQNMLIDALNLLKAGVTVSDIDTCPDTMTANECVQEIMLEVRAKLPDDEP